VGGGIAYRHEVDQDDFAVVGGERGLEDQGAGLIATLDAHVAGGWGDLPAAVLLGAEQGGEAGIGIEGGPAQPVDRAPATHERCRLAIADQGVVFDGRRQAAPAVLRKTAGETGTTGLWFRRRTQRSSA